MTIIQDLYAAGAIRGQFEEFASLPPLSGAGLQMCRWSRVAKWRKLFDWSKGHIPSSLPEQAASVVSWGAPPLVAAVARAAGAANNSGPVLHQVQNQLETWAGSASGRGVVRELRWQAPSVNVLMARLRAELGSLGEGQPAHALQVCAQLGIPTLVGDMLTWGSHHVDWEDARAAWQVVCSCSASESMCCDVCGGGRAVPVPDT